MKLMHERHHYGLHSAGSSFTWLPWWLYSQSECASLNDLFLHAPLSLQNLKVLISSLPRQDSILSRSSDRRCSRLVTSSCSALSWIWFASRLGGSVCSTSNVTMTVQDRR